MRHSELIQVGRMAKKKKCKGKPKKKLIEEVKNDRLNKNITKGMTSNIIEWRKIIHVVNSNYSVEDP